MKLCVLTQSGQKGIRRERALRPFNQSDNSMRVQPQPVRAENEIA